MQFGFAQIKYENVLKNVKIHFVEILELFYLSKNIKRKVYIEKVLLAHMGKNFFYTPAPITFIFIFN